MATYTHAATSDLDADTLAYVEDMPAGFDDTTDMRERYAEYAEPFENAPSVERITRKPAGAHLPGTHWESTACLCSCHFGQRTRDGAPACDEAECRKWAVQNARKAEQQVERKARQWARKQERSA